jgi:PAT family beta-lactamase induction signal transducer AmpG
MPLSAYAAVFRSRTILLLMLLGFSSGLPLALTGGTLQAWLTVEGADLRSIGLFTLVAQPYTYKFVWAPLMDRYRIPFLGRRRGWLVVTQLALLVGIAWMGTISPKDSPWLLAGLAVAVAFLSASQDIVFDAYRAELLQPVDRDAGATVSVLGYRVAMITSGGFALILADNWLGWQGTYWLMAMLMLVGVAATWSAPEPAAPAARPADLLAAIREPLREFFNRQAAVSLLVLIILYKLGDVFAASLGTTFLIRGVGFTPTDVGAINKILATASTIAGTALGGVLMVKLGLFRALLWFGVLQAVTNLGFVLLAATGKSYAMLVAVVGLENICGGMGSIAFVSFLIALCDKRFSLVQFALLTAAASIGRVYVGLVSGNLADSYGWLIFFSISFLVALPGLALLVWVRARIEALDAQTRR